MTRYTVVSRRPDGSEHVGTIITDGNFNTPQELAESYAESFGHELVSVEEANMGEQKDPVKSPTQQPDSQNKTAEERVDKQTIKRESPTPSKTGDVKPS